MFEFRFLHYIICEIKRRAQPTMARPRPDHGPTKARPWPDQVRPWPEYEGEFCISAGALGAYAASKYSFDDFRKILPTIAARNSDEHVSEALIQVSTVLSGPQGAPRWGLQTRPG